MLGTSRSFQRTLEFGRACLRATLGRSEATGRDAGAPGSASGVTLPNRIASTHRIARNKTLYLGNGVHS